MCRIQELFDLIAPLNQTQGKHHVSVTFHPGCGYGTINYSLDWKTISGEKEFFDEEEAIKFAIKIRDSVNRFSS